MKKKLDPADYAILLAACTQLIYVTFHSPGPCNDFCLNGGTCFYDTTEEGAWYYACLCPDGFTGEQCEQGMITSPAGSVSKV